MSDVAIRVEGLSKQYRIGGPQARYNTLRESLVSAAQAPIRRAGRLLRGEAATDHEETIWALKNISFEVKHGEVLGIIGRNGAGKSTLLKILSRITAPTEGAVDIYGRVGSLLEVGTGFHPELTGRENIYLNGAILGMKRNEIDRKFDEIVAFAELVKFLDTPVKHYSSGMYVRLAFAVAAHLDPGILLVDEVLAVGDAAFQKKCLRRIQELNELGSTTLVVTHNLGTVQNLCPQVMWLESGELGYSGRSAEGVRLYVDRMNAVAGSTVGEYLASSTRRGTGEVRFTSVAVWDERGSSATTFRMGDTIRIVARYRAFRSVPSPEVWFAVREWETNVLVTSVRRKGLIPDLKAGQEGIVECVFESIPLRPRRYTLYFGLSSPNQRDAAYDVWDGPAHEFVVVSDDVGADAGFLVGYDAALVSVAHRLEHKPLQILRG